MGTLFLGLNAEETDKCKKWEGRPVRRDAHELQKRQVRIWGFRSSCTESTPDTQQRHLLKKRFLAGNKSGSQVGRSRTSVQEAETHLTFRVHSARWA